MKNNTAAVAIRVLVNIIIKVYLSLTIRKTSVMFHKLLCNIGIHQFKVIDVTTQYHTIIEPDYNIPHLVKFEICQHCGKRRVSSSFYEDLKAYNPNVSSHKGIELAKIAWIDFARTPIVPPDNTREKFTVIDGEKMTTQSLSSKN